MSTRDTLSLTAEKVHFSAAFFGNVIHIWFSPWVEVGTRYFIDCCNRNSIVYDLTSLIAIFYIISFTIVNIN